MLSKVVSFGGGAIRRVQFHQAQLLNGMGINRRYISHYAHCHIDEAWKDPTKLGLVKEFTTLTTVKTHHPLRADGLVVAKPESGKKVHPTVKLALGRTYGIMDDAVDKIPFICAEHVLLMRAAVAIPRNPSAEILTAAESISSELLKLLKGLDKRTFDSIFEVGSSKVESRSKELIEDQTLFMSTLIDGRTPSQQRLRILEAILSPMGMLANAYGSPFCKIAMAKAKGFDVGGLDDFMKDTMASLSPFHVPYIKAPGGPFAQLQLQEYRSGAPISEEDLLTESHFLECLHMDKSIMPGVPQLRSVKVTDPSGRSIMLHDHFNLPHFFDVSGTTGAVMQAAIGLLHRAGRKDLIDTPEKIEALGMVLAGCNFYKQGFHNFYEVLPALSWVIHNVVPNQAYKQRTPVELIEDVSTVLGRCVDKPSTKVAHLVTPVLELTAEHAVIHYEAYKEHVQATMQQQKQTPTGPI